MEGLTETDIAGGGGGGGDAGGGSVVGGSVAGCWELELFDPHPVPAMHNPKVKNRRRDPAPIERLRRIDFVSDSIGIPHSLRKMT